MATSKSYSWKITNSTNKDLIVTLLTQGLSGGTGTGISNADKTAIQLIPKEFSNGVVPAGKSATYTLDWTVTFDDGKSFPCSLYPLVVVTADTFIPVMTRSITLDYDQSPPAFDSMEVTQMAMTAFTEALTFIQQYEAYPKSRFAQDFNAALAAVNAPATAKGGTAASNNQAMSNAVDTFFKGTKTAKNVTFETYLAAKAYVNQYPLSWASSQSQTYYLYSSKQSAGSNNGSYVGAITVNRPSSLSYNTAALGFTMSFAKANEPDYLNPTNSGSEQNNWTTASTTTTLSYANGLFIDTPQQDVHNISVQGLYALESTLVGQSAANNQQGTIVSVLVGTINGDTVIGYQNPVRGTYQKGQPGESDPYLYNLMHPKGVGGVIQSIMEIGGIVMFLDFIWGKVKDRFGKNNKATEEAKAKSDKPDSAEASYNEADLKRDVADTRSEARTEFDASAKSQGVSAEARTEIGTAVDSTVGDGATAGSAAKLNEAVGGATDAAQAAGKYGKLVEKCETSSEKIGEAATRCETAMEEGSTVAAEQFQNLSESATEVSTSYDGLTTAVDKIESGGALGTNGQQVGTDVDHAVTDIESTVSGVDTTLSDAEKALADDPISQGLDVAEAVSDAKTLNEEVTDTIDEQQKAAEETDKVNSGEEEPAKPTDLPEGLEVA